MPRISFPDAGEIEGQAPWFRLGELVGFAHRRLPLSPSAADKKAVHRWRRPTRSRDRSERKLAAIRHLEIKRIEGSPSFGSDSGWSLIASGNGTISDETSRKRYEQRAHLFYCCFSLGRIRGKIATSALGEARSLQAVQLRRHFHKRFPPVIDPIQTWTSLSLTGLGSDYRLQAERFSTPF